MSDSQAYEEITVSSDGVTVTKRFEADEFPVPAIAFNVRSRRSEAVTVRIVDSVPGDVAVEDLGFHPEYGSEYWDIDEDQIAFEKDIEPDAEYTTVYGIRATGTDDVEKFLTEPELASVDPPMEGEEAEIVGGTDDAVKDVIAGDSDSVPGLEDEDDEDIETLDLNDPNSTTAAGRQQADDGSAEQPDDADADADPDTDADVEGGRVVAAMAEEIRQNNVAADDVKLLQRALDAVSEDDEDGSSGVEEARIQQLQQDIADLRAYTGALEEFLEEEGTGDEMIREFESRLDDFEGELDRFESEIGDARDAAESAAEEVDAIGGEVDTLHDDVEGVESDVATLEDGLDDLEAEIDAVREEIGEGELDDRLSNVESEIEDLNEWREQLSSVIGGGD